jgi:signal transduction histidine kinase
MDRKLDLLLVDDDEVDRERLRRLLYRQYMVREAPTGDQALLSCKVTRPDCVLLDYHLPDIDGLRLLPRFVADRIPVVVITGEENPEVVVSAMQLGAQNYLVKDQITEIGLIHAIKQAIEKADLQRALEVRNHQLRDMASALTLAEQRERKRISQILHDHVQQVLHGIQVRAHLVNLDLPAELRAGIQPHLDAINLLVGEALDVTRALSVELSPPVLQREGLVPAFRWLANHMAKLHGLRVQLEVSLENEIDSEDVSVLLYEVTREILFNVAKHAETGEARVSLFDTDEQIIVRVHDSGVGFDTKTAWSRRPRGTGFGLRNIDERLRLFGGRLEVESAIGEGACVTIIIPREIVDDPD